MKRFRFPLMPVKTLRRLREERAREAFALEQVRFEQAERLLREARGRCEALTDAMGSARAHTFRPAEQSAAIEALRAAKLGEIAAAKERTAAEARKTQARDLWLVSRRELEVMHRLEERARSEHRIASEKAEQDVLDELATMNHGRSAALP